jgi:hypothetical protein
MTPEERENARELGLDYEPAQQEPWLLETTQTLAKHMAREFYPEVTQWRCLNDLVGVISQIDNMTTGLMRKPAQRKPLTDEKIKELYGDDDNFRMTNKYVVAFARAIEAAHGIKENT